MPHNIAIIGGGPAGLMAAEILSAHPECKITIYERKPSPARKFLMAGRGGLNITHSEPLNDFLDRYGSARIHLEKAVNAFPPSAMRQWCETLGEETFIGSSGRVFPKSFKASPLLRAWTRRLSDNGVGFKMSYEWNGWDENGNLIFNNNEKIKPDATLLALGGGSWSKLGSDGSWINILSAKGVDIEPLRPANCGFEVRWSDIFANKFAGQPLKPVALTFNGERIQGEAMITEKGIEGGVVYALSSILRQDIEKSGPVVLHLDLHPDLDSATLIKRLSATRGRDSFTNFLRKATGLSPVAIGLIYEADKNASSLPADRLAHLVKDLPLTLQNPFSIDRAISSAGGITFSAIDGNFMLNTLPGVFVAGEMLDWEAPTGGYLLQATYATAVAAAKGMLDYLKVPAA